MTREEGKEFANALKNNYTIDFDKLPEFCDMAISALSENKGDLISRTEVINAIDEREDVNGNVNAEDIRTDIVTMPNVQPKKGEWIPITKRPVTNEEQELYEDQELYLEGMMILTCPLPDDGEEVLITIYGGVETDTFYKDNDGCYFEGRDIDDVIAWQKKPEPYKKVRL